MPLVLPSWALISGIAGISRLALSGFQIAGGSADLGTLRGEDSRVLWEQELMCWSGRMHSGLLRREGDSVLGERLAEF